MNRNILSEYNTLISDTIAYLKEIPSLLLVSKEEWQSRLPSPALPQVKPAAPASFPKETILPKTQKPKPISPHVQMQKMAPIEPNPPEKKEPKAVQNRPKADHAHIKPFLQRLSIALSDKIPDDAAATRAMLSYKEFVGNVDVILFACDLDPQTLELIKNLSKSIDQKLASIKVLRVDRLEREELWDLFFSKNPVKLFIATPGFTRLKNGMVHYKRAGNDTFLQDIPLILLSPSDSYTPKEKLLLWDQLCAVLKT